MGCHDFVGLVFDARENREWPRRGRVAVAACEIDDSGLRLQWNVANDSDTYSVIFDNQDEPESQLVEWAWVWLHELATEAPYTFRRQRRENGWELDLDDERLGATDLWVRYHPSPEVAVRIYEPSFETRLRAYGQRARLRCLPFTGRAEAGDSVVAEVLSPGGFSDLDELVNADLQLDLDAGSDLVEGIQTALIECAALGARSLHVERAIWDLLDVRERRLLVHPDRSPDSLDLDPHYLAWLVQ